MPNYCDYEMKIVGKKENIEKLISYLKADYSFNINDGKYEYSHCTADKHFFRVFDAEILDSCDDYDGYKEREDGTYSAIVYGNCAWSVISCMFCEDMGTYCGDYIKQGANDKNGFKGTHMVEATKDLDLVVEIFSQETGLEFMEHFIVNKGKIEVEECVEWRELYDEDGEPIYDECGDIAIEGGLAWDYSI